MAYLDQAMFLGLRATGQAAVMQCVWIYEHCVDLAGLRRFHHNFGHGLAGRRIEPAILPFGRHRWVSSPGPARPLDIAETPRPRGELGAWLDERAALPVDPQWGPGWHLGVLPMTDGSTAISLVGSHCLSDGGGAVLSVYNAVTGNVGDLDHPSPRSRTRRQQFLRDVRQLRGDLPEVGRALAATARLTAGTRRSRSTARRRRRRRRDDRHVVVPAITIFLDLAGWDARARSLGGNPHSLLAGVAARLGELTHRVGPDGTVALIIPINDRHDLTDTRANAVKLARAGIDPAPVTRNLSGARAAVKQALAGLGDAPDPALQLLPLVPFMPRIAVKHAADLAFGFPDQPVSCSNLGDIPAEIACADGTAAEYVMMRGVDQHVTATVLDQRRGLLTVVGARVGGHMSVTVVAYETGAANTKARLVSLAERTLADFGLEAEIF